MPRQASKRSQASSNVALQGPREETVETAASSSVSGPNVGSAQNVVGSSVQNRNKRSRRGGNAAEETTMTETLVNVRYSICVRTRRWKR